MSPLILGVTLILINIIVTTDATSVKLTYYWVVFEKEFPPLGNEVSLNTCKGSPLARTSKKFADRIAVEGSGYLRDDKTVLNLGACISDKKKCVNNRGHYNCFDKVDAPKGSQNNNLVPFISVAANDIKYGTVGYVRQFDGKKTMSGQTHNGCVRVDDTCSTCNHGNWIDFYVYNTKNYKHVENNWRLSNIDFTKTSCTLQRYTV